MLTCREAYDYANRSLDGELRLFEKVSLQLHLTYCANCRRFARQLALLRSALRRIHRAEPVEEEFVDDVLEAMRRHAPFRPDGGSGSGGGAPGKE